MATFRVGDLIKEQPDGSRALQTQLTGSIEEVVSMSDIVIPPATRVMLARVDLTNFKKYAVTCRVLGDNPNRKNLFFLSQERVSIFVTDNRVEDLIAFEDYPDNSSISTDLITVKSTTVDIHLENRSNEFAVDNIRVVVLGVR